MRVFLALADTGRPNGTAVNALNLGWTHTTAIPLPPEVGGGFTLPAQAVIGFVEGDWNELNRPHQLTLELVDDDDDRATFEGGGEAVLHIEVFIPQVAGAPNGTPGLTTFTMELHPPMLRIPAARRRYIWRATVAGVSADAGFWVNQDPTPPRLGPPPE